MTDKTIRVLYIDDEANNLSSFKASFRKHLNVFTASNPEEAMNILQAEEIHVVITDQYLQDASGVELLESVLAEYPDITRILVTGVADMDDLIAAVNKTHIFAYISKPWDTEVMLSLIKGAHAKYVRTTEQNSLIIHLKRTNEQLEFMLREKLVS